MQVYFYCREEQVNRGERVIRATTKHQIQPGGRAHPKQGAGGGGGGGGHGSHLPSALRVSSVYDSV